MLVGTDGLLLCGESERERKRWRIDCGAMWEKIGLGDGGWGRGVEEDGFGIGGMRGRMWKSVEEGGRDWNYGKHGKWRVLGWKE